MTKPTAAPAATSSSSTEADDLEVLAYCFQHFANLDKANAAIHMADVRFSPITFRLAETLHAHNVFGHTLAQVLDDKGRYPEDRGRE